MPIRVGVLGAGDRAGAAVCHAVASDPALALVAAVDVRHAASEAGPIAELHGLDLRIVPDVDELHRCGAEVAIVRNGSDGVGGGVATGADLERLADRGIHAVVGASSLEEHDVARLRDTFVRSNCIVATEFSIATVLMMRFAAMAAPYFQYAEIIERQPTNTPIAPSLLAIEVAHRMADAAWKGAPPPQLPPDTPGAEGAAGAGDIPLHSVRVDGVGARHELILGTTGQQMMIRHERHDDMTFLPGVLLAAKRISEVPGVTVGLEAPLGL
jgi:4-hydroxy-tetrahydrodipicolinate reductase